MKVKLPSKTRTHNRNGNSCVNNPSLKLKDKVLSCFSFIDFDRFSNEMCFFNEFIFLKTSSNLEIKQKESL